MVDILNFQSKTVLSVVYSFVMFRMFHSVVRYDRHRKSIIQLNEYQACGSSNADFA